MNSFFLVNDSTSWIFLSWFNVLLCNVDILNNNFISFINLINIGIYLLNKFIDLEKDNLFLDALFLITFMDDEVHYTFLIFLCDVTFPK